MGWFYKVITNLRWLLSMRVLRNVVLGLSRHLFAYSHFSLLNYIFSDLFYKSSKTAIHLKILLENVLQKLHLCIDKDDNFLYGLTTTPYKVFKTYQPAYNIIFTTELYYHTLVAVLIFATSSADEQIKDPSFRHVYRHFLVWYAPFHCRRTYSSFNNALRLSKSCDSFNYMTI